MVSPRERVMMALSHIEPDRPPINYVGSPEANRALCAYLGLADTTQLMMRLGVDLWPIAPRFCGPAPKVGMVSIYGPGEDIWGVIREAVPNVLGVYNEVVYAPLARVQTVEEVDAHRWPSLDWFDWDSVPQQIDEICSRDDYYITFFGGSPFEDACQMCGMERFLTLLALYPAAACRILDRITDFMCGYIQRTIEAGGRRIDMVRLSDDLGGQHGLLISPAMWGEHLRPRLKRLVDLAHEYGVRVRYHSDGDIWSLVGELVDVGIDVLNPLQFTVGTMTPEELKARYGALLSFDGGIDTQHVLPLGTEQEVRSYVLERIRILGAGGGYIVNTCHNVQPDVPPANIVAMYEIARAYRYS